jgi:hypothetical protein
MTLAVDSQESGGTGHNSTTSPLSWSFTNTAGTLLIVGIIQTQIAGATIAVTYNGVSMTQVSGTPVAQTAFSETAQGWLFFLVNPATGSHTVSVTITGTFNSGADILGAAISFTGQSSSPVGTAVTNLTGTATTTASVSVTGTTNGSIVLNVAGTGTSFSSANSPTVLSALDNASGNTTSDNLALGYQPTSGGTVTAAYTISSDIFEIAAVEIFAALSAGQPVRNVVWL